MKILSKLARWMTIQLLERLWEMVRADMLGDKVHFAGEKSDTARTFLHGKIDARKEVMKDIRSIIEELKNEQV